MGGAILYLPAVNATSARSDLTIGTWMFILGSLCFEIASYLNSLGIVVVGRLEVQSRIKLLSITSLGVSLLGSALFMMGSLLFFPQLIGARCNSPATLNLTNVATMMYVLGCGLYLLSAILNTTQVVLKRRSHSLSTGKDASNEVIDASV